MDDRGGQLQHPRLRCSLGSHLNSNSTVAGEGIGQDIEVLSVDPDSLGGGVPELPDARTNLGSREIGLADKHWILISGGKRILPQAQDYSTPFPESAP
jgi:hypothetical protein